MKNYRKVLAAATALTGMAISLSAPAQHRETSTMRMAEMSAPKSAFHDAMRKLWEDHVLWTRMYIISAAKNLPDKKAVTTRLLANQTQIGNAVKPYYGSAGGNKLTALLRDHILIAAEVVSAAKANNKTKLTAANRRWFANADQIARFLSNANPTNWKYEAMRDHMHEHLNLTTQEAVAYLKGDWNGSIVAYDKVHQQILHMADALSDGIVAQFPDRFGM